METQTVLISGAGIAGPTLAYWLEKAGLRPTLIERAPAPRLGGYVIDFWGLGYDIAERMGLLEAIDDLGYHMREMRIVGDDGKRLTGFGIQVFRQFDGWSLHYGKTQRPRLVVVPKSERSYRSDLW